jgi:hypothetical protein
VCDGNVAATCLHAEKVVQYLLTVLAAIVFVSLLPETFGRLGESFMRITLRNLASQVAAQSDEPLTPMNMYVASSLTSDEA